MRRIGLILVGFVLGVVMAHWQQDVRAQGEHSVAPDVSVRELLEVMADFDIRHMEEVPYARPAYGVTVFDNDPPTIFIFNGQTHYSKMSTIIHEAIHIRCARIAVECDDEYVRAEESRQYQKLFGVPQ